MKLVANLNQPLVCRIPTLTANTTSVHIFRLDKDYYCQATDGYFFLKEATVEMVFGIAELASRKRRLVPKIAE